MPRKTGRTSTGSRTQAGPARTEIIRTYSPKLISEKTCGFDGDLSHAPKMEAARGPDGLIPVRRDEHVIRQRTSHDLY